MPDGQSTALLRGLTSAQRAAVMSDAAPLSLLAGAGSGKTTVLTRRVARRIFDGSADPEHITVVTFTRKAAAELRGRLARLQVPGRVWAGTFHAAAYAQLRRSWADRGMRPLTVLDRPARLLHHVVASWPDADEAVASVGAEVHWAQSRLLTPTEYEEAARKAGRCPPVAPGRIADAYARYVEAKRTRGLIDFNDLLTLCADLLEQDRAIATATHWRIRHLFVDEFQDVNPAQWRLLRAWLGDRHDLFVVGDPRQAVYGWNGADPSLLDRLPQLLPGTSVLRLDRNHRSSPQVIAAAQAVLGEDGSSSGTSQSGAGAGEETVIGGKTERPDGPLPVVGGFRDDADEAAAVARWLRQMHRPGRRWSHLAVLARTNARLETVAAALRSAGIPVRMGRGDGAGGELHRCVQLLRRDPPGRLLRSSLADMALSDHGAGDVEHRTGRGAPAPLARLADEHALEEPGATVGSFLDWLSATVADLADADPDRNDDAVELTTFHRSKGLEWPVVAVIGLEDGLVPISYATSPEARAEEQRLLYVAVTRAEEDLWCSWARQRSKGGWSGPSRPSPLLAGVARIANPELPSENRGALCARVALLRSRLPAAR